MMEKFVIKGGSELYGEVTIHGAKNATLPILSAVLLANGEHKISNVPATLLDIQNMLALLETLGCDKIEKNNDIVTITNNSQHEHIAHYNLLSKMRAGILVLGPLLAKNFKAKVALPGGCAIGSRPVDIHLKALEQMGARIDIVNGYIEAETNGRLKGCRLDLAFPTVTGTENILMAAALADGVTTIHNAAKEPEIIDLAKALITMGAKIEGAGTDTIRVEGQAELKPMTYSVMPDRIEAGTFMCAAIATGGNVIVRNAPVDGMGSIFEKFALMNASIEVLEDNSSVHIIGSRPHLRAIEHLETDVYPHFPTDMQAQFMALLAIAKGTSTVTEKIFENRFMHVPELVRMGADISVRNANQAIVKGVCELNGAPVMASDLRASASLIIAGLAAKGTTEVLKIYHLDRGYEFFEKKLQKLGADIVRESYSSDE